MSQLNKTNCQCGEVELSLATNVHNAYKVHTKKICYANQSELPINWAGGK